MRRPLFSIQYFLWLVMLMACAVSVQAQSLRAGGGAGAARTGLSVSPGLLAAPDRSADFIVALVDNEPITNHDVRMAAQRLREQAAQAGVGVKIEQLANDALELLIFERSQIQWAEQSGVRISETDLQGVAEGIATRNQLTLDDFYREIERQGLTKKRFLQNLKEQQILQRLRDREVPGRIRVSEPEIDRFLSQEKANLVNKASIELAQILIPLPESSSEEQVKQAEQTAQSWRREIEQGADFFELARQRSASPERIEGGRMGLREVDRYPDLFIEATRGIAVGGLAGPIRSGAGLHLLKVIQRNQSSNLSITQTRARHILLRPSGTLSQNAARAQLYAYKTEIERGRADFAQLAREHSSDGSAAEGGDLGWANPGQFVPEFEDVMDALKPGQVSDPFVSRFGVHLLQVIERRQLPLTPTQERDYARRALRAAKYDETLQIWAREIRGKAFIEYREPPQ
jgi:peptidyl-prolyl cis-trans isomerase SurA